MCLFEDWAWMGNAQCKGSEDDHTRECQQMSPIFTNTLFYLHSLQSNKLAFIVDQWPTIAIAQFVNTVGAANENKDRSGREGTNENQETRSQLLPVGGRRIMRKANGVVNSENGKHGQSEDLEGKAGKGNIDTRLGGSARTGRSCTTRGLQSQ